MEFKRNLKKVEEDAFSRGYVCLADTTRKVDEDNHAQAESSILSTPVVPEAETGGDSSNFSTPEAADDSDDEGDDDSSGQQGSKENLASAQYMGLLDSYGI